MASRARWDPFRDIASLQGELNRLIGGIREDVGSRWVAPVDVWETDAEIVYAFELPGFDEDAISIELEDNVLTVSGERKRPDVPEDRFHHIERRYGPFSRSVTAPSGVSEEDVSAQYVNGVLQIKIAKPQAPKPRTIKIGKRGEE